MKLIRDLGIRRVYQPKNDAFKNFGFGLFLCPVCGGEAERKKGDGLKQKRCCGGQSKIAPKGSPLHNRYVSMTQRCFDKNATSYKNYGGRGINVCDAWRNFDNFAKWALSNGFDCNMQLDRIDSNKDYSPDNCRFITQADNNRNKRNNIHTHDDVVEMIRLYVCTPLSIKEIAEMFSDSAGNVANIIRKRSWDIETEWDKYVDSVALVKKTLPSRIRKMWKDGA